MFTVTLADRTGASFKVELDRVPVVGDYVILRDDTVWLIDRVWQRAGGGVDALGRRPAAGEATPPDRLKAREG